MSSQARPFKFLQLSDVHLDSLLSAVKLPISQAERNSRRREINEAFYLALDVAKQEDLDAVLISGDLWDNRTVKGGTVTQVIAACAALGDIPVVIIPGESDFLSYDSMYNDRVLQARGLPTWPENVHIFKENQFTTFRHPHRLEISFTGRAITSPEPVAERALASYRLPREQQAPVNVLLFYGSLDDYPEVVTQAQEPRLAPFSEDELAKQEFTYAALGGNHDYIQISLRDGALLAASSGCLAGRGFDEPGPRVAILGSIQAGPMGRWQCTIEPMELDRRRMILVGTDISGLTTKDMVDEITLNIEDHGGRVDTDFVYLQLEGNYRPGSEPATVIEKLRDRYYQVILMDHTRPDYLSEHFDERTTEWKFVESLLEMKKNFESGDGAKFDTTDQSGNQPANLSGSIIEDALYYGLDALRQKRIIVRDVD